MTRAIVVTGTDTDVGKTVFAAGLTTALGARYWKPIQAGTPAPNACWSLPPSVDPPRRALVTRPFMSRRRTMLATPATASEP